MKKKKLTVYGTGGLETVTRYRIWQYYTKLENVNLLAHSKFSPALNRRYSPIGQRNIIIKCYAWINMCMRLLVFFTWDVFRRPDIIVVQRELVKSYTPLIINLLFILNIKLGSKVIWDYDDNILAMKEVNKRDFILLAKYSTHITVTHDFLKNLLPIEYSSKAILLPTTDGEMYEIFEKNMTEITEKRLLTLKHEMRVVWVATKGNLKYLEGIAEILDKAAANLHLKGLQLRLLVICNGELRYNSKKMIIENIVWTKDNAINGMLSSHVGIMPLVDNEITKGKGSFKLVQYMSVGLPCVSSNVGFNKNVVNENMGCLVNDEQQWIDAIAKLTNVDIWKLYSQEAFKQWKSNFSYEKNLNVIRSLIV